MAEPAPAVRVLRSGDEPALLRFLGTRPDTTMFLRANLARVGLEDDGAFFSGTYAAAWRDGEIVGAAAHFWNGDLVLECPVALAEVARCAIEASARSLSGLIGPRAQVDGARIALGVTGRTPFTDSREDLFALDLDRLRVPDDLARGRVTCRRATEADVEETLTAWRLDYEVENLGGVPSDVRRRKGRELLDRQRDAGHLFVLAYGDRLVAMTAFNAALPDCVQVGGVYTPPALRARGFARCAVAGSLLAARDDGAHRSILFTEEGNAPAQACYRALGYERVGDYGLVLFDDD